MSLYDPIINYCERTAPGLMEEPLNAISNISFFIAVFFLVKTYRAEVYRGFEEIILIALVFIIGVGSTLFHTFANGLTMRADVIPISLFTFYYLWVAMRRPVGLSAMNAFIGLLVFTIITSQIKYVPEAYSFNGSIHYFPSLFALLLLGGYLAIRHSPSGRDILAAALLFVASICLRSLDYALCETLPIGTHFLWHLLNGAVLYLLVIGIIKSPPKTVT